MEGFVPDEVQPEELSGFTPDADVPFVEDTQQPKELDKPMFEEGSLGNRIQTQLQSRVDNVEESSRMMAEDEQTYLEAAVQGFGQVLMAGNDIVSESILELLSGMTPDAAESFIKEQLDTGATALMDTNTTRYLYDAYSNLSPRARKDLDAAANVGLSLVPMSSKTGKKLKAAGFSREKSSLGKYLLDQSTAAQKARNAEMGMDKAAQTTLNREDAILNTALSIKGITSSTPRKKMMGALNSEVARLGTDIRKALANTPVKVPKGIVTRRLNTAMAQFKQTNPEYAGKDLSHVVDKVKRAYLAANKSYTGRPEELLEVRRKFDKVIERFFGKDVHGGDHTSRPAVAHLRNELNQLMQDVAPDAKIRSAMQRQHHAMIAKDNLAFNMVKETGAAEKLISKAEHHPYFVAGALSGGGMTSQMLGGPLGEALGLGAGMLGAGYLATRPSVLKGAGSTLETLNPTKSLLIDALNQQAPEVEEQQ
jgi:hypothetical protein